MTDTRKKELIKSVCEQMRMNKDKKMMVIVLTDEEDKMSKNELKAHLYNEQVKDNNKRLDEILKINEIV